MQRRGDFDAEARLEREAEKHVIPFVRALHFFDFVEDLTNWHIYPASDGPDFWFENKVYRILSSTTLLRNPEYAERAHVLDRKILTEQRRLNKQRNVENNTRISGAHTSAFAIPSSSSGDYISPKSSKIRLGKSHS